MTEINWLFAGAGNESADKMRVHANPSVWNTISFATEICDLEQMWSNRLYNFLCSLVPTMKRSTRYIMTIGQTAVQIATPDKYGVARDGCFKVWIPGQTNAIILTYRRVNLQTLIRDIQDMERDGGAQIKSIRTEPISLDQTAELGYALPDYIRTQLRALRAAKDLRSIANSVTPVVAPALVYPQPLLLVATDPKPLLLMPPSETASMEQEIKHVINPSVPNVEQMVSSVTSGSDTIVSVPLTTTLVKVIKPLATKTNMPIVNLTTSSERMDLESDGPKSIESVLVQEPQIQHTNLTGTSTGRYPARSRKPRVLFTC